jgi:uncharacterized SAM-binding protein YcdF (DUF218 family)
LTIYLGAPAALNRVGGWLIRSDAVERADVVVALGGDNRCNREKKAVELYRQKLADKIIVSGVQFGWGVHTGEAAKRYVMSLGVSEADIIILRDVTNTRAEAQALKKLMNDRGWTKAIIVTSSFHSRRALYTVEKSAPELIYYSSPVPAEEPEWRPAGWWKRRGDAYVTIREVLSWVNTLINGWQ